MEETDYSIGFLDEDARAAFEGISDKGRYELGRMLLSVGQRLRAQEGFVWGEWNRAKLMTVLDGRAYVAQLSLCYHDPNRAKIGFDALYEVPCDDPMRLKEEMKEKLLAESADAIIVEGAK